MEAIMTFIDHIPWSDVAGFLGIAFLVIFVGWFVFNPISRDKVLVKFGWQYFVLVFLIMASCTCLIAWLISKDTLAATDSENPFMIAIKYCLKMQEAKDAHLNIWAFIFIMLFQIVVFEGLVLAAIVGWTGRRSKQYQKGDIRYSKMAFVGKNYAVVIGANEVAPSVIKNLLKHEDAKNNSLDFAHEEENQYVILQTSSEVGTVRQMLQAYLTEDEYERVIIYSDLRNSYEGLEALHLKDASEIYVLGENTTIDGGETYHDTMNMRCVNLMAKILGNRMGNRKVCKVLFEYQTTFSIFQFSDVTKEVNEAMIFVPFNRYESWARRVLVDNKALALVDENHKHGQANNAHINQVDYTPLDGYKGIKYNDEKRVHFIVVGMSKMGVAMGTQALFQAHYPNYETNNNLRSRITFIDANAEQEMQFFKGRYATLFELARHRYIDANTCAKSELESDYGWVDPTQLSDYKWAHLSEDGNNFLDVEIEFVKGELESEGVREYLRQVTADNKSKVTIAICLPQTHQAVAAALYMPIEVYKSDYVQDIWVYQREAADVINNLTLSRDNNLRYKKLKPFGMLYGEYIDSRTHYLKALLVNAVYDMDGVVYKKSQRNMGIKKTYKDLRSSWNDLSITLQWSNKYFVDSMHQKIRSMLSDYMIEGVSITGYGNEILFETLKNWGDLYLEALQAQKDKDGNFFDYLARCEHNRWNLQQLLMGYMPADTDTLKIFETLDAALQTQDAKNKRNDWRKQVNWEQLEPLEKKKVKQTDAYKQLPHGIYDQTKNTLKEGICHIHPNICHYDLLSKYDSGAEGYDKDLNQNIPNILMLVDGYKKDCKQ